MTTGQIIRPQQSFNGSGGANAAQIEAVRAQWKDHLSGNAKAAHTLLRIIQAIEEIGGVAMLPMAIAPLADAVGIPAEAVDAIAVGLTTAAKTAIRIHGENRALEAAGLGQHAGGVERFMKEAISARGLTPLG